MLAVSNLVDVSTQEFQEDDYYSFNEGKILRVPKVPISLSLYELLKK